MPENLIQPPIVKVSFFDRPVLVVSIVSAAVIATLFVLAYFGIVHY